jgi:cell division transport system permease protein
LKPHHPRHVRTHKSGATRRDTRKVATADTRESMRTERDPRGQGAIQSQLSLMQKLDAWFGHHSHSSIDSLLRLLESPIQSVMTWLVIAIAVALPAALFLVFDNLQQLSHSWQDSSQISVFMKKETTQQQARQLSLEWTKRQDVLEVVYVSPQEALEEFKQGSGLGDLVNYLDENPLPSVVLIKPRLVDNNPDSLTSLQQTLIASPQVADVRLDLLWVKRLHQFIRVAERFLWSLSGLLVMGVLLVIGNSIRTAIDQKRDEIRVSKLVGATDAYVRRPFLYMGLWYGLIGGLLASVILGLIFFLLSEPVQQLANLYQSSFRLRGLELVEGLQLMLMAGVIGLLGAWLAVGRQLRMIRPG